ncbi:hypothetical protein [Stigmatella erecta]|nr:hypothetical protein [Stigmatella erecta]
MRRFLALCVMVLGTTVPRVAQAQDDFQRSLLAAEQLYERGEKERALAQLQRVRELARGLAQEVAVALREGIILADLDQRAKAQTAFREGLLLDPEARLPLRVSPTLERDFEEVRAQVRKELGSGERPALPRVKSQESPPAPLVQTDRPKQPHLKAPEGQTAPPYAPSAAAVTPARTSVVPPIVLKGAEVVAVGLSEFVFQSPTCPAGSAAFDASASKRGTVDCQVERAMEPGGSMTPRAAGK